MSDEITTEQPQGEPAPPSAASAPTPEEVGSKPAQARLVKIKFRNAGRHYDFNAQQLTLKNGDRVVVETDRGRALGVVVAPPVEASGAAIPDGLKNVLRHASNDDMNMANNYSARERDALIYCRNRAAERRMDMKLVRAEYLFDGSKIIFYFTADGRVDFRDLVKDLAHYFHTRIEMRQIGVRDEAKLTGGIGVCGRELCCCSYLTEFAPVSVKMAKEQGLALNPTKISGQCGRLLCCLAYEYETYCDLRKALPKCGRKVVVDGREGEVVDQQLLRQSVTVVFPDQKVVLTLDEIEKGVMTQRQPATESPRGERSHASRSSRTEEAAKRESQRPSGEGRQKQSQPQQRQPGRPPSPQGGAKAQTPAAPAKPPAQPPQPPQPAQAKAGATPPQDAAAGENRRKRHRNRRRSGRKSSNPNPPESGE